MKLKIKSCESLFEIFQEGLGFVFVLESDDKIVRVSDDNHIALCGSFPPLVGPKIKDIMQVDIRLGVG